MFDDADRTFFNALRDAAAARLGRDHPCFLAADHAAESGDPDAASVVQNALDALDPDIAAALMADVHKALREDPAAILCAWKSGGAKH